MTGSILKRLLLVVLLASAFTPVPSVEAAINVTITVPITIGTPFRVTVRGMPEGSKLRLMASQNLRNFQTWELTPGADGRVDTKLEIPIGTRLQGTRIRFSMRYYDPERGWLDPTRTVYTLIQYGELDVDVLMPVRKAYPLEVVRVMAGLGNSSITNHLSELYKLENIVYQKNLEWLLVHKVQR